MNPVLHQLQQNKALIFDRFGLQSLALFGSYADEKYTQESDVDVLYTLKDNSSLSFRQTLELEKMIRSATGVAEVDLVNQRNMNPIVWLDIRHKLVYV